MIIGNAASEGQENVVVNEGTNDQDFTVGTSNVSSIVDENALNVKILERCFSERIDREMNNFVETVEDRIQNAILTAIDNIVVPKIQLAIRSKNTSSGRNVTSVSANSERREHAGINAFFENASENNNKLNTTIENDETRQNIHDEVSELSVPGTHFDRQPHTHHTDSNDLGVKLACSSFSFILKAPSRSDPSAVTKKSWCDVTKRSKNSRLHVSRQPGTMHGTTEIPLRLSC